MAGCPAKEIPCPVRVESADSPNSPSSPCGVHTEYQGDSKDLLSRYYEHDYWTNVPELHNYVNANVRLDPEHDNLPRERTLKIEGQVIENRVQKTNSAKIQAERCALRERIQERDTMAAQMDANEEEGSPKGEQEGECSRRTHLKKTSQKGTQWTHSSGR